MSPLMSPQSIHFVLHCHPKRHSLCHPKHIFCPKKHFFYPSKTKKRLPTVQKTIENRSTIVQSMF
nr:MAG TPA: hypothetical protein [Caudoviricetes sp.]